MEKGEKARAEGTLSREPGTGSVSEQGCDSQCGAVSILTASSRHGMAETAVHLVP